MLFREFWASDRVEANGARDATIRRSKNAKAHAVELLQIPETTSELNDKQLDQEDMIAMIRKGMRRSSFRPHPVVDMRTRCVKMATAHLLPWKCGE